MLHISLIKTLFIVDIIYASSKRYIMINLARVYCNYCLIGPDNYYCNQEYNETNHEFYNKRTKLTENSEILQLKANMKSIKLKNRRHKFT